MPVLYYDAEVIIHQKQNINELKRIENDIIRTIYGIPKRCKMSNLKLVIDLNDTTKRLKCIQIEFFLRLLSNEYTKAIIKDLLSINNGGDYISDVLTILNEVTQAGSNNSTDQYYRKLQAFFKRINLLSQNPQKKQPGLQ
ncbi:unnamed protein product [Brachionus calyciflorus]|uniref:Uncharacterized protein n=1 Tax=Brachionus calyciflorus TaxID=104777 RepID=A0A814BQ15_9BILA|nr:unnamed protein product [Brachionus calyciflorus]